MTDKSASACQVHGRQLRRSICVVLFAFALPTDYACGADKGEDPYDVLYNVIMTRYGKDGTTFAENETSPAIFTDSEFPFGDKTYTTFNEALDAFGALPQEKIEAYSHVKRALMQRHLWKLSDATSPHRWIDPHTKVQRVAKLNHSDRRTAVQPKLASLIRRLALTKAQIMALPDTLAETVESGDFALDHDPKDQFKPFLPADVYADDSSWVCIGTDETIPADLHVDKLKWRSAFFSFIRLPNGRSETIEYVENAHANDQFPVGTQLALIEQAFLISDNGEQILSPLIVSISLRAYLYVNQGDRSKRPSTTQSVAEFVMQPRELMQGNPIMKALNPLEHRFVASEGFIAQDTRDPFETGRLPRHTRLNNCMSCHRNSGNANALTVNGAGSPTLFESNPATISKVTSNEKRDHHTWKSLVKLWQEDSSNRDTQSHPRADQPQPSLEESTTCESDDAADPYDALYDVIMTRYGNDGKTYAENESSPSIFPTSVFPFGNETYETFNAALNAFADLPQAKIEAYSDIERALLQRHLWKVFDAAYPREWQFRNKDRRAEALPKIASLIQRLALTREQILALPNTFEATVESGQFKEHYDPKSPLTPFLPTDLYAKNSSWVCLGESNRLITASRHTDKLESRSTFLQFMSLPGGRTHTLGYFEKLHSKEVFPVGTQFALIEQAFLISNRGELILSPLIVSIQLRAYLNVDRHAKQRINGLREATQCVAEFVMQPRQLRKGNAVMQAITSTDFRFEASQEDCRDFTTTDPFERGELPTITRLNLCMECHGAAGRRSVETVGFYSPYRSFEEGSPETVATATSAQKLEQKTWIRLQELWLKESSREEP